MKKQIAIIITFISIGFIIGMFLYKTEEGNSEVILSRETENISINQTIDNNLEEVKTSSKNIKITPNTEIIEEIHYTKCGHIKINEVDNKEFINMTKEDLEKANQDWEIEDFSENKVLLLKQVEDFCNEHYLLKDVEGYINIYKLDENDNEAELVSVTEIPTKYLSQQDREQLSIGIKIYSKQDLNKLIEDFE